MEGIVSSRQQIANRQAIENPIDIVGTCEDRKVSALLSLYQHTHAEITRYRDYEWKTCSWVMLLLGGVAAFTRLSTPLPLCLIPCLQLPLAAFAVVAAIYGAWHIHFLHKQLTWNRCKRREIEDVLKFYDSNVYKGDPVLPETWKDEKDVPYWSGKAHLATWWALIGLMTLYVLYSIFVMLFR